MQCFVSPLQFKKSEVTRICNGYDDNYTAFYTFKVQDIYATNVFRVESADDKIVYAQQPFAFSNIVFTITKLWYIFSYTQSISY